MDKEDYYTPNPTIQKVNPNADILFIGPADMATQINGQLQLTQAFARD
jgi:hypothetical protein